MPAYQDCLRFTPTLRLWKICVTKRSFRWHLVRRRRLRCVLCDASDSDQLCNALGGAATTLRQHQQQQELHVFGDHQRLDTAHDAHRLTILALVLVGTKVTIKVKPGRGTKKKTENKNNKTLKQN